MQPIHPGAHVIRLRGPWQLDMDRRGHGDGDASGKRFLRLPATWRSLQALGPGHVRLVRTFHRPSGLEPAAQLFLVAASWPCPLRLALRGEPLGRLRAAGTPGVWEIGSLLDARNRIEVELTLTVDDAAAVAGSGDREVGHFWLEIVPTAS